MPDHINIFHRKPLKSNVPSKRYEPWISVFERLVLEAQTKITKISKHERLYNVIKDFLDLQGLVNETRIEVDANYIYIIITALPTTHSSEIVQFNARLCETLYNHKFRLNKEVTSIRWGCSWDWDAQCIISCQSEADVLTRWRIPSEGIADLEVHRDRKEVTRYETTYTLIPRVTALTSE